MLGDANSQLSRWLKGVFGSKYDQLDIYATNLVKCFFSSVPSRFPDGSYKFLKPFFDNYKEYLTAEITNFKPRLLMTLGEPAHRLFVANLDEPRVIPEKMKEAFTGRFVTARLNGVEFDYSPCLHIQTFRIAETYKDSVTAFKSSLLELLEHLTT